MQFMVINGTALKIFLPIVISFLRLLFSDNFFPENYGNPSHRIFGKVLLWCKIVENTKTLIFFHIQSLLKICERSYIFTFCHGLCPWKLWAFWKLVQSIWLLFNGQIVISQRHYIFEMHLLQLWNAHIHAEWTILEHWKFPKAPKELACV